MIDIHNHVLAGIDDGPQQWQHSIAMLEQAKAQGISHVVVTPHLHFGRFDNTQPVVAQSFARLQQAIREQQLDIHVAFASEVRIDSQIMAALSRDLIALFHGQGPERAILLELPHSHVPLGADKLITWLNRQGLTVVLPHPERNREIKAKPHLLARFKRLGCLIQVTAGSLLGDFGDDSEKLAVHWLEQGEVDLIASDAHSCERRPFRLAQARERSEQLVGKELAQRYTKENPWRLCQGLF
tara:strand:+ start:156 stop:878 length:723 start_codon:yes stop_codon:yes gene_type:complete